MYEKGKAEEIPMKTKKEAKYLIICKSLIELHDSIKLLEDLLSKIQGQKSPETEPVSNVKVESLCLVDFLESTPEKIEEYISRLNELRAAFDRSLF